MNPAICSICNSPRSDGAGPCSVCGAPPLAPAYNLPAGTHLQNGRFTLGRVLGEGGFGITYLGAHRYLKRTVAIKELFPERAMRHGTTVSVPDSQQRDFHIEKERVLEEARAIARLDSPYIVEVQDAFLENNTAYIVMEYLEGESLQERIDAVGSLPPDDVHWIAMAVCDALTEVHRHDLLHRDIKPANIMLTSNGRVVLVDFGSARVFDQGQTVRHTRILTMDYAAPEMYSTQARFGPYTDLFCLGGSLFHALTGRRPPSVMDRLQGGRAGLEFPDALQGSLSIAIRQALQIAIEDRPPSAAAFKSACEEIAVPRVVAQSASAPPGEQVWNPATTSLHHILHGHAGVVLGVDFSPNGRILASFEDDSTVRLWDVVTGKLRHTLKAHWGGVAAVLFSSDSRTLAVIERDRPAVRLWDVDAGTLRYALEGHRDGFVGIGLSPDGRTLAVVEEEDDTTIHLWDVASGTWGYTLEGHRDGIYSVKFSPDSRTLAVVERDWPIVHLWDVVTGTLGHALEGHSSWNILDVAISPDGRTLALVGDDTIIRLWDVTTGSLLHLIKGSGSESLVVHFLPDSRSLFVNSIERDGLTVQFWDVVTGGLLHTIKGLGSEFYGIALSYDGRTLAIGGSDNSTVHLWDVVTGELHHTLAGHRYGVYSMKFSPDGKFLVCGGGEGAIYLWNGTNGV